MKFALYASFVLLLVPIQTTLLDYISILGVRPDLCLVTVCLVGFLAGQGKGLGFGMGLGFVQDLFSAGGLGLNMVLKGLAGILSGLAAKTLLNMTPVTIFLPTVILSLGCGLLALISARPQIDWFLLIQDLRSILLPQALFDATMALFINWVIARYRSHDSLLEPSTFHRP